MDDRKLEEKIISREVVYPGVIISLEHWQVELPDGAKALREIAVHHGASAVVAVDEQNRVVLVRQHRVAVGRVTREIPAGKLNGADEDPFEAARRELSEETGLEAEHWEKLTVLETTPGFCSERIHLYLATGLRQGECHPDADEFVAAERMPLTEAVDCAMNGTFRDGKTIAGVLMAARKLSV